MPVEYRRVYFVFHVSYLPPNLDPAPPLLSVPLPLDGIAASEYEVKDILDSQIDHSGPKYLVKWLGYPVYESVWEPASHFANTPVILH